MTRVRLALAQMNPTVGALRENRIRIEGCLEEARGLGADAVLFPELALTGYPPEDLLLNREFLEEAHRELLRIVPLSKGLVAAVGVPLVLEGALRNGGALLHDGRWVDTYAKGTLPNYGVFDEKRYFRPGLRCPVYAWRDLPFGLNICEDLWVPGGVPRVQAAAGARWLWNLSSSPYHADKGVEREALLRRRARVLGVAIAYCNLVGGQDELVFDGESLFVDASGVVRARGPQFREALVVLDLEKDWLRPDPAARAAAAAESFTEPDAESIDELEGRFFPVSVALPVAQDAPAASKDRVDRHAPPAGAKATRPASPRHRPEATPPGPRPIPEKNRGAAARLAGDAEIYAALQLGLSDYIRKNGFRHVLLGLSGGIDSALTAAIAADALGPEAVTGVSMPSRHNRPETRSDAALVARNLGIRFLEIPIEPIYSRVLETLAPSFAGRDPDVTEENIQARVRGVLLMALSNKTGALVLTTGNKSELAVGYCTLYGDMAGGLAVLKDVPKTLVYRLAQYRNTISQIIPATTIARPPSAELRDNQADTDTLPPYEVLDAIVQARMETEEEPDSLVKRGLDPRWVETVYRWIDANEYKRRQAPPGIRITPRAFGRDRRYPITNRYRWRVRP